MPKPKLALVDPPQDINLIRPEFDSELNPVDYFNNYGTWFASVGNSKKAKDFSIDQKTDEVLIGGEPVVINGIYLTPPVGCKILNPSKQYTKFMVLCKIRFNGNYEHAWQFVKSRYFNAHIPYVRVGTDYFKITTITDRYGIQRSVLKVWTKDEIKLDNGPDALKHINKYDDFIIRPSNTNYREYVDNGYNLYRKFNHTPLTRKVTEQDIPTTLSLLQHVFGSQLDLGLTYMQALYQLPTQPLPILCLVSQERGTGKTTFLNFLEMLFCDNFVLINPEDLTASFNSSYATKNIIALDETVIDKSHAIEKLKSIVTAKSISVNQKFVQGYSLPFFGKVIICTNKEKDFMRIDEEEIRFWVRKINSIDKINTSIELSLKDEIPAFLAYLNGRKPIDTSRSRMVLTPEEISNDHLELVKSASQSNLRKELTTMISDFFDKNPKQAILFATRQDIKDRWFKHDQKYSSYYISQVLQDEMKYTPTEPVRRTPFESDGFADVTFLGRYYEFQRKDFTDSELEPSEHQVTPWDTQNKPPF